MRYLVWFVLALALVVSPLSACAQDGDKERLEEFYPGTLPESPEEFDRERLEDFIEAPPTSLSTAQDAVRIELRVKRARNGLIGSSAAVAAGGALVGAAFAVANRTESLGGGLAAGVCGLTIAFGGLVGMIVTGVDLRNRKRELRQQQEAHYETPRRVQWDLAKSRLVF